MHMRTTLNIDQALLQEAGRLTGLKEKTALVRLGLQALIARESARRRGYCTTGTSLRPGATPAFF